MSSDCFSDDGECDSMFYELAAYRWELADNSTSFRKVNQSAKSAASESKKWRVDVTRADLWIEGHKNKKGRPHSDEIAKIVQQSNPPNLCGKKCKIFDWLCTSKLVGEGEIETDNPMHLMDGIPIGGGIYLVYVERVFDPNVFLWRNQNNWTTLDNALDEIIPWLKEAIAEYHIMVELLCFSDGSDDCYSLTARFDNIDKGNYLLLNFVTTLLFVMYVWHYVQVRRHAFDVEKKVSTEYLFTLGSDLNITRVPGIGLLCAELTQGIPSTFFHFLSNLPALRSVLVFISMKHLAVNMVPTDERFLLKRIGPNDYKMYRCIVRYGYGDKRLESEEFENLLMEHLRLFIRSEFWMKSMEDGNGDAVRDVGEEQEEEIEFLEKSRNLLELKENKYLLGEFLKFKRKNDDISELRNVKRSKVSHSKFQMLYFARDYRNEGTSASDFKELIVRSNTKVLFQPYNSSKVRKFKLSSIISLSLSA
ncbi:hypothetical protein Sjap_010973 [Stephania japonica]|uniref:K+ potassium transporter C-terminal domain-containing protein n=1 Tax=Stephania japonica TaxID=461633 RepID=A0AAP0JCG9_9MAGN